MVVVTIVVNSGVEVVVCEDAAGVEEPANEDGNTEDGTRPEELVLALVGLDDDFVVLAVLVGLKGVEV